MPLPLADALARDREQLLDSEHLVRALASGRRKGQPAPTRRLELRYVDLKAGRHLQVTSYEGTQAFVTNHAGEAIASAVDELLAEPFGNWHVETASETVQLRVTKNGEAAVSVQAGSGEPPTRSHDRAKPRLLPEDAPVLRLSGSVTPRDG